MAATSQPGWASFPDCVARSSLLGPQRDRGSLDESMFDDAPAALRPLAAYIAPSSRWVPEVAEFQEYDYVVRAA